MIWRVDVVYLTQANWKYEGSGAMEGKGGRTHTFGVKDAAKTLAGHAAYALPGIAIKNQRPVLA